MFFSKENLAEQYGVDLEIGKFFVDREPPKNNLYWKDKLLYLRPVPGYFFIPLVVDMYHKMGLSKSVLLNESYLQVMEAIGDIAAKEEAQILNHQEAIAAGFDLVKQYQHTFLYQEIDAYFNNPSQSKLYQWRSSYNALHRGDYFMFSLCALPLNEHNYESFVKTWFVLISLLLLMDDYLDYEIDKKNKDENAIIEAIQQDGDLNQIYAFWQACLKSIAPFNNVLANTLQNKLQFIHDHLLQQLKH